MYSLSIALGDITFVLHFKHADTATIADGKIKNPGVNAPGASVEITDDFGQKFRGALAHIHGSFLEDCAVATKIRADRWIAEQIEQVRAQQTLMNDPKMKAFGALNGGMPSVLRS